MKKTIAIILSAVMLISVAGCSAPNKNDGSSSSQEPVKQPSLSEIHQAVKDAYGENYLPNMELEEKEQIADFSGLNMDDVEEVIINVPMISAHADFFYAVKAKEGKGDEIKTMFDEKRDFLINEAHNYPMNMPKVNASKVIQHGDYVFFFALGALGEAEIESDDAAEFAQEQAKIGEDAINEFFK